MYGSAEAVVGELCADLGLRSELFLATKVWTQGREDGIAQMERSFALMRAGKLDLMQVHNLVDVDTHTKTLLDVEGGRADPLSGHHALHGIRARRRSSAG